MERFRFVDLLWGEYASTSRKDCAPRDPHAGTCTCTKEQSEDNSRNYSLVTLGEHNLIPERLNLKLRLLTRKAYQLAGHRNTIISMRLNTIIICTQVSLNGRNQPVLLCLSPSQKSQHRWRIS